MKGREIYDMLQENDPHTGCDYCPYVAHCVVLSGDTGYTSRDEWGSCPEEYSLSKLCSQLTEFGIVNDEYPMSEALYISLRDFESLNKCKLSLNPL